jgi:hypothetical protein
MNKTPILLIDGSSGVYVPQRFIEEHAIDWKLENVDADSIESIKNGPDDEWYWEAWIDVTDHATHKDGFTLYQDDDLWAVHIDDVQAFSER